jgi:uncharacterized protein
MTRSELIEQMQGTVRTIAPTAQLYLYGSRARGTARPESDWDLLVLLQSPFSDDLIRKLRRALYEIEWMSGEVISVVVRSTDDWRSEQSVVTPFYQNVSRESLLL